MCACATFDGKHGSIEPYLPPSTHISSLVSSEKTTRPFRRSGPEVAERLRRTRVGMPRVLNMYSTAPYFRAYFEGETTELHPFYVARLKHDLGPLWDFLPAGSLKHDSHAYMNSMPAPVPATR